MVILVSIPHTVHKQVTHSVVDYYTRPSCQLLISDREAENIQIRLWYY